MDIIEVEGPVTWSEVKWNDISLKVRTASGEKLSPKDAVYLDFPDDRIHVFDKSTGLRA